MPLLRTLPVRGTQHARGGFTLIEMLVVIAIMAIMLVVSIQVSHWIAPESELGSAAEGIASSVEQARSEAIICGRVVWFELDLGEDARKQQWFRSINEPEPGKEKEAEDDEFILTVRTWQPIPNGIRIESVIVGEEEPWTRGKVSIAIQPDGTMPSHLIRLHAAELDPDNEKRVGWACVQVAGLLGQARVLNRYVEPEFLREGSF